MKPRGKTPRPQIRSSPKSPPLEGTSMPPSGKREFGTTIHNRFRTVICFSVFLLHPGRTKTRAETPHPQIRPALKSPPLKGTSMPPCGKGGFGATIHSRFRTVIGFSVFLLHPGRTKTRAETPHPQIRPALKSPPLKGTSMPPCGKGGFGATIHSRFRTVICFSFFQLLPGRTKTRAETPHPQIRPTPKSPPLKGTSMPPCGAPGFGSAIVCRVHTVFKVFECRP